MKINEELTAKKRKAEIDAMETAQKKLEAQANLEHLVQRIQDWAGYLESVVDGKDYNMTLREIKEIESYLRKLKGFCKTELGIK